MKPTSTVPNGYFIKIFTINYMDHVRHRLLWNLHPDKKYSDNTSSTVSSMITIFSSVSTLLSDSGTVVLKAT